MKAHLKAGLHRTITRLAIARMECLWGGQIWGDRDRREVDTLRGSADAAQETIRQSTTDIESIASHMGIKPTNIQKVKQHLFYAEHLLDRYVHVGVPAEMRRFDSDLGIANAWKRLEQGNETAADRQLLRHKAAEAYLMRKWHDQSYNRAHTRVQKRFPALHLEE